MAQGGDLYIVGIGASAGGIEALQGLFRPMSVDTGLAFVIVTHLAPNKVSMLDEVLGRFTGMPVTMARDGVKVEANHVYVITPDSGLTIERGRLRVHALAALQRALHPIDLFFASLAEDQGDRAIGIVLSGGGSDGTLGIKAIKEHGGLTIAQGSAHSAPRHTGMPSSAIATGLVDLVVQVEDMADKLVGYVRSFVPAAQLVRDQPGQTAEERTLAAKGEICAVLRAQIGHEFGGYKEKTFLRRVQRRMQVIQLTEMDAYIARLRQDPSEVMLLFRDLLIGVTTFFRDAGAFDALAAEVIPRLLAGKDESDTIRVWVPGCATGEEVFSIAILLCEHTHGLRSAPRIQVFGTDIDEPALAIARAARYPASAFEGVSGERLQRFFSEDGGTYQLIREVRELCIFSIHSLVRDPPFSRMDLVSCRNLLIYLDGELQSKVIPVFHYALRRGGFLFLGISENVSQHSDLFAAVDKKNRIFQRRDHASKHPQLPLLLSGPRPQPMRTDVRADSALGPSLRRTIETRVLERFSPAHVVVNRDGDVVYFSLRTGKYLEAPPGQPSRHLLALARKGLRLDLRNALQEAAETRHIAVRDRVAVDTEDRVQLISVTVEPLGNAETDPLYLVLFADLGQPMTLEEEARERAAFDGDPNATQLEADLRQTRERLQAMIEEYETGLEELKAANEELVSMNEELQSTNEELETSKEEIQSVNEELQTVNAELGSKVEQLNQSNADLRNLFDSTQVAVVFLDRKLAIRSFTPAVGAIFNLIPTDRGRPLTDIATSLGYDGLADDVRHVLTHGQPMERRVNTRDERIHYLMRILPYQGGDSLVSGALVTFVDITLPVQSERQLQTLVQELNHRVRNLLAVVGAIATQTAARISSPAEFTKGFLGRINALGRSHRLLARERWGDIALGELIGGELEPHIGEEPNRLELRGPRLLLKPKAALTMGLMVHELATNAAKYGSLSTPAGKVAVSWELAQRDGGADLVLHWREAGGPLPPEPPGNGFGTVLLERQVKHEWGGSVTREFLPEGASVTLVLPENAQLFAVADGSEK